MVTEPRPGREGVSRRAIRRVHQAEGTADRGWGKGTLPFRHGVGDTVSGGKKVADEIKQKKERGVTRAPKPVKPWRPWKDWGFYYEGEGSLWRVLRED